MVLGSEKKQQVGRGRLEVENSMGSIRNGGVRVWGKEDCHGCFAAKVGMRLQE